MPTLPVAITTAFGSLSNATGAMLDANLTTIYQAVNGIGNGSTALANVTILAGGANNLTIDSGIINISAIANSGTSGNILTSNGSVWISQAPTSSNGLSSKTSFFTRDPSAADGDVAISNVGFTPTAIDFWTAGGNPSGISYIFGSVDSSKSGRIGGFSNVVATSIFANAAIRVLSGGVDPSNYDTAVLKTYDANGFTLTWTKTGAPGSSTETVNYTAKK